MRRIAELDALRGLAVIGIVAFHYGFKYELHDRLLYAGSTTLELFFVLSGFLISSIILAHQGEPGFLGNFYVRRGLRIWPAYYLFILATGAVIALKPAIGSIRALPYYLTFTQYHELYVFEKPLLLSYQTQPTWSLAVEEQFYIVWPLLLAMVGARRIVPLAFAFIAVAILARLAGFRYWILLSRCDGFAVGGLLAAAMAGRGSDPASRRSLSVWLAILGAASLAYLMLVIPLGFGGKPFDPIESPGSAVHITVSAIFYASVVGLVACHAGHPLLAPLRARWLVYLGVISYGIYLYHESAAVLGEVLVARLRLPAVVPSFVISSLVCLGVSSLSWYGLEKPCLKLKDRFGYGRVQVATPIEDNDASAIPPLEEGVADPGAVSLRPSLTGERSGE